MADWNRVAETIANFISHQMALSGRRMLVLGLSGGIDSALVAALGVRALGKEQVHACLLPCRPSPAAETDALLVARHLGLEPEEVNLEAEVALMTKTLGCDGGVRLGNVMARLRMITLYDRAAKLNGLVAGTGNRSEYLLGYFTRHGDGACDLAPLVDLYKTQVWELARHLGLPEPIVAKTPTADLWSNQTDESELGLTYREADAILHALEEDKQPPAAVRAKFGPPVVDRVLALMEKRAFKRAPVPFPAVQSLMS